MNQTEATRSSNFDGTTFNRRVWPRDITANLPISAPAFAAGFPADFGRSPCFS